MTQSYFKNHPMYRKSLGRDQKHNHFVFLKFEDEIGYLFKHLPKTARILEIGLGNGDFSSFCYEHGFQSYIGIDIDDAYISELRGEFSSYTFEVSDINEFLKISPETYDIIFMSHVFEHLPFETASSSVKLIYEKLTLGGYWINYMPNADSMKACGLRHIDITHQTIYNVNSFEQILFTNDANFSAITHCNTIPAISSPVKRVFKIVHPFFLLITKVYYYGMGMFFPAVYTSEMLSIMKK